MGCQAAQLNGVFAKMLYWMKRLAKGRLRTNLRLHQVIVALMVVVVVVVSPVSQACLDVAQKNPKTRIKEYCQP